MLASKATLADGQGTLENWQYYVPVGLVIEEHASKLVERDRDERVIAAI